MGRLREGGGSEERDGAVDRGVGVGKERKWAVKRGRRWWKEGGGGEERGGGGEEREKVVKRRRGR